MADIAVAPTRMSHSRDEYIVVRVSGVEGSVVVVLRVVGSHLDFRLVD